MDSTYFYGYQLEGGIYTFDLSMKELALLMACCELVDNKWTLDQASANSCIPRSTLHRHIHNKLPKLSHELYKCVVRVMKENETYKFGGVNFGKRRKGNQR